MSKTSKRAISILVIATFMMSIFAAMPVKAAVIAIDVGFPPIGASYEFDETIVVTGTGVTSGAVVNLYWDYVTTEGLQNNTQGEPDGTFEVSLDVPEATVGEHYLWVKDVGSGLVDSRMIMVTPLVELSPSSGLKGDDVDVEGHGFGEEVEVGIVIDPWTVTGEDVGTGNAATQTFAGTLDYFPIVPNTVSITDVGSVETITDNGAGGLSSPAGGTGTLSYITGVYSVTFFTVPAVGPITADYDRDTLTIEASTSFETDEFGAFTKTFDIPDFPYGDYDVTALDIDVPQNTYTTTLTIGASITVTPEEGPTGTIVTVEGRGWTTTETITFREETSLMAIEVVDRETITVGSGGTFSADVVIPVLGSEDDYDIEAQGTLTPADSSDSFELTGLPEVEVSPVYGTPGASITVTGSNFTQISGVEVTVTINTLPTTMELVIAETNSDGTFEETFMSPAVEFKGYTVTAEDEYYIDEDDSFKVGLIALIINPVYGEAGTEISITGIGFLPLSSYNVTFGTILYEDYGTVNLGEAISDTFYVPNVEPGTYDMTIIDEDENELTVQFSVTAVTEVDLDPAMAPNKYNVTIDGYNFADKELEEVYFVLYNATDEWDMDVWQNGAGDDPVETDDDGNFTAWWLVLEEDDVSLGDYTINVTGYDDFLLQVNFSVVEARVSVAPRKALFDRGDTIQFNVRNDFDFDESYMEVWDPFDNLYWQTELFEDWVKSGDLYTVPYYLQTSGMNPMTLSQDAPLGTWFYIFYETGTTELVNGTFEVGPSSAAQVDEKLTELWGSIEDLTSNIDDITSEIGDDIDALSGEIDDVVADVQDMVDDITADLAGELAQVAADTEAAVGDLEDSIGDIASAQNELSSELDAVSQDTTAAREAAEDAQTSAQGLTTLVYGAIGASLIAALAAIVSLMQISKKIA